MALSYKNDSDQDERLNPASRDIARSISDREQQGAYDRDFGDIANNFNKTADPTQENQAIARAGENQGAPSSNFVNKWTGAKKSARDWKSVVVNIARKKGATIGITSVLGISAGIPFIGGATLPFSIVGNMNSKSILRQLNPFMDEIDKFQMFGIGGKSTAVTISGNRIAGLTNSQIDDLKNSGAIFTPENGTRTALGKKTFNSIEIDGELIDINNFDSKLANSPHLRTKVRISKTSLWKASRSEAGSKVKQIYKLVLNPQIDGTTDIDRKKSLINETVDTSNTNVDGSRQTGGDEPPDAEKVNNADGVAGNLSDQIDEASEAVADGTSSTPRLAMNDIGSLLGRDGVSLDEITGQTSIGSKIWGFANSLDAADMVCTVYQMAYTANVAARGIALTNFVRFGYSFITAIQKAQAGDDTNGQLNYFMSILSNKDPSTGLSFDSSSYAAFLFNGSLSSQPSAVSALGGRGMLALMTSMRTIHSLAGFGSVQNGRAFLKTACGLATNLGVQIGATIGGIVVGIFSGGTSFAAGSGIKFAIQKGAREVASTMVERFGKEARERFISELGEKSLRSMATDSWRAFRNVSSKLSGWDKAGLMFAGVSLFGTDYLIKALSGEAVVDTMDSGLATMDSIGTAREQVDYTAMIAHGGSVATYAQATTAMQNLKDYERKYIEDMRELAKSTPLDIKNPYSALGSTVFSIQKTLGISNSLNFSSTLSSILSSIARSPGLIAQYVSAAEPEPTAQEIGEYVGDEFYSENNIAVRITGTPFAIANKKYSLSDVYEKLVYGDNPQITADEINEQTGEPILKIVPGSELEEYKNLCHNPERIVVDPEFAEGDALYDRGCMIGGDKYNALYSNAISYMYLASPDSY